jgi:tetratricopeptide (TPR) repeat protein
MDRGHEALRQPDLDRAVTEFEEAIRNAPNNAYAYKHLAEARMLQSDARSLEEAVSNGRKAIKLNESYASAHCLVADCLLYQDRFGEALIHYETACSLEPSRTDFLTRYGVALAGMQPAWYLDATRYVTEQAPDLVNRTWFDSPIDEAIDKFSRVRDVSEPQNETPEHQKSRLATYNLQMGQTYLQAALLNQGGDEETALLNKAVECFAVARKYDSSSSHLAQAYTDAWSLLRTRTTTPGTTDSSADSTTALESHHE